MCCRGPAASEENITSLTDPLYPIVDADRHVIGVVRGCSSVRRNQDTAASL
jgi:hypothetical protein